MKIAFLAAANSIHGTRWIKFFADQGHEIVWITLAPPDKDAGELLKAHATRISFHEIRPSPLADINGTLAILHLPLAVWRVKRIFKKTAPDILHIHSAGTYGFTGTLAGFHPAVLTPWGSDILLSAGFKKRLVEYVIGNADYLTCDGENTIEKLVELGAKREKIELIRFGVDVEKFKPKPKPIDPYRPITVISLRTLIPVYDLETLIRAAEIVLKKVSNVNFVIAGDGDQRTYLEKLAIDLHIDAFIKFIGRYSPDKLPDMFEEADIYVSTALSDSGLAASTAEAMAAGLPVVVSDSGDNRAWVDDGSTSLTTSGSTGSPQAGGFVFPCSDFKMLAEKIVHLIQNPEARISFGVWNRRIIEEKNNYYREMAKVETIYQKLVEAV